MLFDSILMKINLLLMKGHSGVKASSKRNHPKLEI